MIKYVIIAILIFGVLIAVHELGHFMAAKACGVRVNEFSIGMGPALFQKKKGETDYSLRILPIGGYCAMEGEDEASSDPRSLTAQSFWKQFLIFVAGAAMNFLTGLLILVFLYAGVKSYYTTEIVSVHPDFPLQGEAGILPGDEIYKINGERVYMGGPDGDVSLILQLKSRGDTMEMVVVRDGEKLTRTINKQYYVEEDGSTTYRFGFSHGATAEATPAVRLRLAWYQTLDFARLVRLSLQMLLTGSAGMNDLSGPVGIVSTISEMGQETEQAVGFGEAMKDVFYFAALIAVNLALMNLLPLPALDGGKVLFLLLDTAALALFRKKIPAKYENWINAAGFVALMGLMLVVTFNDVLKLF